MPDIPTPAQITVEEFETKVYKLEGIVIIIRAGRGILVEDYPYKRRCPNTKALTQLLDDRILPCVGALEVEVLDGCAEFPSRRQLLRSLRASYK